MDICFNTTYEKGVSAYWENSSLYSVSEDTCDGIESSYSVKSNIYIYVCIYIL